MCGPGSTDLQRQDRKQTFEIRQELTQLQEWDTEENQTLEERRRQEADRLITEQREMNQQLAARAAGNLPQVQAREAAPGNPVQEQAAVKKSYKQRREESRRTKEAKKGNIAADHISYTMVEQLKDLRAEHLNSMTEERNLRAIQENVDRRVLGVFVQGYRKNKKGMPATEEDARKKREDDAFYEDYISKDLDRRRPHLNRFVNELINTEISPDMFSDEYMEKHTREMKNLTERLTYFSNVMNDPINQPYFENMPRPQKDLFEAKRIMTGSYSQMFISAARAKAVNVNENTYHTADLKSFWGDMVETPLQMAKVHFNQDYEEFQRREREIYDGVVDQEIEREIPVRLRRNEEVRRWAEASDETAVLNINTYATRETYERLGALRSAIESNPGYYEANKQMVDDLYQRVYRTVDVLGDRRLRALASEQLCDIYENATDTQEIKKRERALAKRELYAEEAQRLEEQFAAGENAIDFFLKDKPLSDTGRELIIRSGYSRELVRKRYTGPGGFVEKADAKYRDTLAKDGYSEVEARSEALQALAIRDSSSEAAALNNLMVGQAFAGIGEEYKNYFHELEDVRHVDMQQVLDRAEKTQFNAGGYNVGEGIDQITGEMLEIFLNNLTSPESVRYFKEMVPNVQDAVVFGGNLESATAFLAQMMMTKFGANTTSILNESRGGNYQSGQTLYRVAVEACRTLLCLSGMPGAVAPEVEAGLPQQIQTLLNRYREGLRTLLAGMAE